MLKVSHVGLKVKDLRKSVPFYKELLNCESLKSYEDDNFKGVLLKCGDNTIELIEDRNNDKSADGVIEHIAFKVENIEDEISKLRSKDVHFISSRIEEFQGIKLFFFRGPDGEMLEFVE